MFTVLLALALSAPAPLHLADLLKEARERNPELRSALAEVRAARSSVAPAGALDDPMLSLQLWNAPVDLSSVPLMVQLSQNLPLGGKRAARRETATADLDASRASAAAKVRDVEQEVAKAYFELFMADREVEVDLEIERTIGTMVEAASARVASGRGELVEELKAEGELLGVRAEEETARAQRASANVRLATLLDRDPSVPLGPTGVPALLPSLAPERLLRDRALASRPELAFASAGIAAALARLRLARAARVPDLGLSAAEMHAFTGGPGPHDFLFLGVQGNLPLFEGEKNEPKIDAATAEVEAKREAEHSLHNRVLAEVADALAHVVAEEHLVRLHHQLIPLTHQVFDSAIAGYTAGRTDFLMVLDSVRDLRMHELDLAAHLGAYEQDLADLEHAVGADLGLAASAEAGHWEAH